MSQKYREYLRSPEWRELTSQVRRRCDGICERCHRVEMCDTHHLTYERVYHERLEDLLGVCRSCHKYLSGRSRYDPLKLLAGDLNQVRYAFEK